MTQSRIWLLRSCSMLLIQTTKNVRDERIGEITDEIIPALEEQFLT